MNKLKNLIRKIKKTITEIEFVVDSLFLVGVITLIITNFIVNPIFGMYSTSVFLIGYSLYLNKER